MQIEIIIREKIARTVDKHAFAVCGNSDYTVKFDFDSEWDSYETKTARFKYNGSYTDVPFSGDTCPMPVITNAYRVEIGVYAGELRTSSPALLPLRRSILDGDETEAEVSHEIKDTFGKMLAGKIDAPQVAQVGEVLTVEEVDEDGKPVKWKTQTVDVDGVLKYTEQELTTEEQAQARENIGAQQTDFIINVEENEDGVVAADKTLVEIKTAYESKVNMWAVFYGNRYVFQGYLGLTGSYLFVCVMDNVVTKYGCISMIEFNSNGNISIHGMEFTALYKMEQIIVGNGGAIYGVPLGQNLVPENATYVTVPKASGLKAGKVLTTTGKNGVLAMEWKDINFPVTITSTTTDDVTTYTADKTFAEIKAAYDSGANVYAVDSLEQDIFPLRDIDSSSTERGDFWFYGIRNEFRLGIWISINSDDVISVYKYNLLTSKNIKTYAVRIWETLADVYSSGSNCYGICKQKGDVSNTYMPDDVVFPAIVYVGTYSHGEASLQVIDANGVVWAGKFDYGTPKLFTSYPKLPSPATAQVGQIVKVKAVDANGKITETETVDMPTQKTLKWITVQSFDLTETKRELIINTDTDGKSIADYNPVGLSLIVSTPADATAESNNGAPWIYPSTTKFDNAIRVIGSISGWKTIARDSAFVFNGGSSAMSCSGNVNTSLATYKLDGYALDGVRIFFNSANDHLPVGTHVEVSILCEVEQ